MAGIAHASLSPRLGVHVERLCCARRRALVAAFSDVAQALGRPTPGAGREAWPAGRWELRM